MIALKLAFQNILGSGLRAWLSIGVLSLSYVVILWQQGLLDGWSRQSRRDTIEQEIGGGQYWHSSYDPFDFLTYEKSHAPVPVSLRKEESNGSIAPILVVPASIYPEGRMQNVLLKGISPEQKILSLPTFSLAANSADIPVLIGQRMARATGLGEGDWTTIQWRDAKGVFDARDARIVQVMKTDVPALDKGILWLPLDRLRSMLQAPVEATLIVVAPDRLDHPELPGWRFRDQTYLLKDITNMIRSETVGNAIMYGILLCLALLAIFDTQILAVFRRRREIGTLIALGMTRGDVIRLFTVEGALHGVLAMLLAGVFGSPILIWQAKVGLPMPKAVDSYGIAIAETIYPVYSFQLIATTTVIVMAAVSLVSFIPARKISRMNPTEAIQGKLP